jgi:hypothetical protein
MLVTVVEICFNNLLLGANEVIGANYGVTIIILKPLLIV